MKKTVIWLLTCCLAMMWVGPAGAVCTPGTNWTQIWTDQYGETTYTLTAPCKVYLDIPFNITATVTDSVYPNDFVGSIWSIVDNGSTIFSDSSWIKTVGGQWQKVISRTYTGTAVDHYIEFKFIDTGHGGGGMGYSSNLIGDLTVDPLPPTSGNISSTDKFAWSETSGWLNFRPFFGGVSVYDDHLEGYAWAENIGWVKMGSYSGGGPYTYTNADAATWGVNVAVSGDPAVYGLSGYGWSETSGWINFGPAHGGVSFDRVTGGFSGHAWAENVGWIHFDNAAPAYNVTTVQHAINLNPGPNGSISCDAAAPDGWNVTCSIVPLDEYYILSLSDNTSPVTNPTGSYQITGITGDHTLEASFAEYMVKRVYGGGSAYARTLVEAYDGVTTDWERILLKSYGVFPPIDFNQLKYVVIEGGYSFGFVKDTPDAVSAIPGNMTVTDGAVTTESISIQP